MKKTVLLWLLALVFAANLVSLAPVDAYAIELDLDFESLGSSTSQPADTSSDGIVWVKTGTFNCTRQEHQHQLSCYYAWNSNCPHSIATVHVEDKCHVPITTADCSPCTAGSSCTRQHYYANTDTASIVYLANLNGKRFLHKEVGAYSRAGAMRRTLADAIVDEFNATFPNGAPTYEEGSYYCYDRPWHVDLVYTCTHVCTEACLTGSSSDGKDLYCKITAHTHGGSSCYGAPYTWKKYYDVNNNGVADKEEDLIITFESNGGTLPDGSSPMTRKATRFLWTTYTIPSFPAPARSGYAFDAWYADQALTQTVAACYPDHPPVGSVTFYAGWKLNAPTVTLTLDGGTLTASASHENSGVTYQYEWYLNGEKVDGSTSTLQVSGVGDYSVKVKATDGALVSDAAVSNAVTVASVHNHAVCGDASCGEHETLPWTAWDGTGSMPASGNVYLTNDVLASSSVNIPSGSTVNLCLNGYDIQAAHANAAITVSGTLSLCDCTGGGSVTHSTGKTGAGVGVPSTGTLNLYSGSISGNTVAYGDGNGAWVSGTLNMYGGSITRNGLAAESTSAYGGGVALQTGGVMNLYGGSISDNRAERGGGVAVHQGTLNLYGGSVTSNTSAVSGTYGGGGIYLSSNGSVKLQSCSIAGNVDANGAASNLYIGTGTRSEALQLTLADGFTGGPYAFSVEKKPAKGSPVRFLKRENGSVTQADLARFVCQDTGYELDVDADGYGVLRLPDVQIDVPAAIEGLKYTGEELTGVAQGEGYTLTGHQAADAGDYTATAKLEAGYRWSTGSSADADIQWSIAKADGPAAPTGLTAAAPTIFGGSDGSISGVDETMEYADNADFTNAASCTGDTITGLVSGTYYVRVKETANVSAGAAAEITVADGVTTIAIPTAAQDLQYTSAELTGVAEGAGYTLSGHKAVNAGDYMATATLSANHQWQDGTAESKQINWNIRKADPAIAWNDQTVTYTGEVAVFTDPVISLKGTDALAAQPAFSYTPADGTNERPVNAGAYTLTISTEAEANYNAASKSIALVVEKATPTGDDFDCTVLSDEDLVYDEGEEKEVAVSVKDGVVGMGDFTVKYADENGTVLSGKPVDAGYYKVLVDVEEGSNYTAAQNVWVSSFSITLSATDLTASVGGEYTYGEVITVTGSVEATGLAPQSSASPYVLRRTVQQPTATLYFELTELASAPVVNGQYTLTYNTTDKLLPVGENRELTVVFSGSSNLEGKSERVYTTLKPKMLTGAVTGSTTKVYDGTTDVLDVASLWVTFGNIESVDEGKLAPRAHFAYADAEPGQNKTVIASIAGLSFTEEEAREAAFYTAPATVTGDVGEITRIPLTAYANPADAEMDEYCADAAAVIAKLPAEVTYTTAGSESVALNVSWACSSYDNTPKAKNTFTWTVDEADGDLTYYMIADGVSATDSITVTNDDIIPVTVEGKDGSTVYDGSPCDVSSLFTVTPAETAGEKTYSIVDGTGEGTLSGSELIVTKAGTFVVQLDVAQSLPHAAATGTATLTVNKGEAAIPTGLTAYYGQTLSEIGLPEGWSWQKPGDEVGNRDNNIHLADYAGSDLYAEKKGVELIVTVSQADTRLDVQGESNYYYGENIELTVKVTAVKPAARLFSFRAAPAAGTVSVWNDDAKLFEQAADNGDVLNISILTLENGLIPGSYTLDVKYTASDNMNAASAEKPITISFLPDAPDPILPKGEWISTDPTLTAPEGWTIAESISGPFDGSITPETTDGENVITCYLRNEDGQIAKKAVTVSVDKTAPVIESVTADPTDTTAEITVIARDVPSGIADYELVLSAGEGQPTIVDHKDGTFDVSGLLAGRICTFTLTVTDKAGNTASIPITVQTQLPPAVVFPKVETEVHVFVGQKAEMKIVAENAYRYEWYRSVDGGETYLRVPGASSPEYAIEYALMKDDGNLYVCRAYGESGVLYADSPVFRLRVEETLPQTGDDTPLALLLGLCLMSLTAMIAFGRRRRIN